MLPVRESGINHVLLDTVAELRANFLHGVFFYAASGLIINNMGTVGSYSRCGMERGLREEDQHSGKSIEAKGDMTFVWKS